MADNYYDPTKYGTPQPASGAAAGVGYALQAAKDVRKYLSGRKSDGGGGGSSKASPDTSGGSSPDPAAYRMAIPDSYKRGGLVRKTGLALVHKGERVRTAKQEKARKRKRGRGARR